ncbi:unnamed protein product, partial [Adineta steineri]
QTQCLAASFHESTSTCELFANVSNLTENMLPNADIITMIVQYETRMPQVFEPEATAIQTSTATMSTISACIDMTTPAGRAPSIGWDFEGNLNDRFSIYNGTDGNKSTYALGRTSFPFRHLIIVVLSIPAPVSIATTLIGSSPDVLLSPALLFSNNL